jgi:hypothetical protein
MILRETRIHECWCSNCAAGQMEQIHDLMFKERIAPANLAGWKLFCHKCGHENTIEDFLSVIPTSFLVASQSDINKVKSNEELKKWLDKE